jgi:signal transduction histidine kinase
LQENTQQIFLNLDFRVRESHGDLLNLFRRREIKPGELFTRILKSISVVDIKSLSVPVISGGKTVSHEITVDDPNKDKVLLLLTLEPFVRSRKVVGMVVTVQDITWRKQQAEQSALVEKIVQMTTLTNHIVEKINHPLATILNRIGRSLLETDSTRLRSELDHLQTQIYKLTLITNSLESFVVDPGLHNKVVDVQRTCEKSVGMVAMIFPHSHVRFELAQNPVLARIRGNEVTLEQCFIHILRNAAEASPKNGVVSIVLQINPASGYVDVEISDQGVGMSELEISRACEPFYKNKKGNHFGLGLSLSYIIIAAHRGFIKFKSIPEKGTTVTISLPLEQGHSLFEG